VQGKASTFFLEKKKQKTFTSSAPSTIPARSRAVRQQEVKGFSFFSSEKNTLQPDTL